MVWLPCPFFGVDVELRAERGRHASGRHTNVGHDVIAAVLATPELVIERPWRLDETLLVRIIDEPGAATHIVVAVVRDEPRTDFDRPRHWVVTAYRAAALPSGIVIWQAN